jgi:hypothetical protein
MTNRHSGESRDMESKVLGLRSILKKHLNRKDAKNAK